MSRFAFVAVVVAASLALTSSVASAAVTWGTWGSAALNTRERAAVCTNPGWARRACSKTLLGNFYFTCAFDTNAITVWRCSSNDCATGCSVHGVASESSPTVPSWWNHEETVTWSNRIYNNTEGWATEETFTPTNPGCNGTPTAVAVYPASISQCLPLLPTTSQKWYYYLGSNSVTNSRWDSVTCSGVAYSDRNYLNWTCSNGNATRFTVRVPPSPQKTYVVMFLASAASVATFVGAAVVMSLALML